MSEIDDSRTMELNALTDVDGVGSDLNADSRPIPNVVGEVNFTVKEKIMRFIRELISLFNRIPLIRRYEKIATTIATSPHDRFDLLAMYVQLAKEIPIVKRHDYKARNKYRINVKSSRLDDLINTHNRVILHITKGSLELEWLADRFKTRHLLRFDLWLTNKRNELYHDDDAFDIVVKNVHQLIDVLMDIKKKNPATYSYYMTGINYLLMDYLEVMSTMVALQLDVQKPD